MQRQQPRPRPNSLHKGVAHTRNVEKKLERSPCRLILTTETLLRRRITRPSVVGIWQDLAAAECRSFLKTSAGREELRATTAATREQRRRERESRTVTAGGDSSRSSGHVPGVSTLK